MTDDAPSIDLTIDFDRINAWDALCYRSTFGAEIEPFLDHLRSLAPRSAADNGLIAWLWHRQNGRPDVSVAAVAQLVPVFPAELDEAPTEANVGAPEVT
jgi:hypothetical protein